MKVKLFTCWKWKCPNCLSWNHEDGEPVGDPDVLADATAAFEADMASDTAGDEWKHAEATEMVGDLVCWPDRVVCLSCGSDYRTDNPHFDDEGDE